MLVLSNSNVVRLVHNRLLPQHATAVAVPCWGCELINIIYNMWINYMQIEKLKIFQLWCGCGCVLRLRSHYELALSHEIKLTFSFHKLNVCWVYYVLTLGPAVKEIVKMKTQISIFLSPVCDSWSAVILHVTQFSFDVAFKPSGTFLEIECWVVKSEFTF